MSDSEDLKIFIANQFSELRRELYGDADSEGFCHMTKRHDKELKDVKCTCEDYKVNKMRIVTIVMVVMFIFGTLTAFNIKISSDLKETVKIELSK